LYGTPAAAFSVGAALIAGGVFPEPESPGIGSGVKGDGIGVAMESSGAMADVRVSPPPSPPRQPAAIIVVIVSAKTALRRIHAPVPS
jgi:hypothetical protein